MSCFWRSSSEVKQNTIEIAKRSITLINNASYDCFRHDTSLKYCFFFFLFCFRIQIFVITTKYFITHQKLQKIFSSAIRISSEIKIVFQNKLLIESGSVTLDFICNLSYVSCIIFQNLVSALRSFHICIFRLIIYSLFIVIIFSWILLGSESLEILKY